MNPLSPVCPTAVPLNVRWTVDSSLKKKNSLFLTIGPPMVPPNTFTLDVPMSRSAGRKYGRARIRASVAYSNADPLKLLVPVFTCTFTAAAPAIP